MHTDILKTKSNIMIFGTELDAVRCSYKLEKLALHISGYVVSMPKVTNFRGGDKFYYMKR